MYLEHVQAVATLAASRRGQVKISLISPSGTKSILLEKRNRDSSADGFDDWAFMTTHNWGEMSYGTWELEVSNTGTNCKYGI
jgi:subtilisin-like proprotein convertase family protein